MVLQNTLRRVPHRKKNRLRCSREKGGKDGNAVAKFGKVCHCRSKSRGNGESTNPNGKIRT
jgi:hypothetical protein